MVVANKIDGPEHDDLVHDFFPLGAERLFPVSAEHGYGIRDLLEAVTSHLPDETEIAGLHDNSIRVAVIGRPNVGKSSLVNRILGEKRLLVSDVPGTTRDTIDTVVNIEGQKYVLTDTAGIRRKSKVSRKLEKFSIIRAFKGIEHCHTALLLIDAGEGLTEQDVKIAGYAYERGRSIIILMNKWDLVPPEVKKKNPFRDEVERRMKYLHFAPTLPISALTGKNVPKIFQVVREVYGQFTSRISTSALNRTLAAATNKHSPPRYKNLTVKLNYITQIATMPPTFSIFTNRPEGVHFSYERYLVNQIREKFGLTSTPIKLLFKRKSEPFSKGGRA